MERIVTKLFWEKDGVSVEVVEVNNQLLARYLKDCGIKPVYVACYTYGLFRQLWYYERTEAVLREIDTFNQDIELGKKYFGIVHGNK